MFDMSRRQREPIDEETVAHDDRRAHERHPAYLQTTCYLVDSEAPGMKARVQDVSLGGIHFLLDRELPPGTRVRIDLPRPATGGESVMLASVMHCYPQVGGVYSVGCAFSDELGDEELREFSSHRESARGQDKRAWTRFPAHGNAEFSTMPPTGSGTRKARIASISTSGIGLLLDEKIEPGVILDLMLETKTGSQFYIPACVVYLGSRPEGGWVAGCHFVRELAESDMRLLL